MGFVYIVEFTGQDCVKIGMTKDENPFKRINSFKTYAPHGIKTLALIEADNAKMLESIIHSKYKNKRIKKNREFFSLSKEDVEDIKKKYEENDNDLTLLLKELKELFPSSFDLKLFLQKELEKRRGMPREKDKNYSNDIKKVKDYMIKNHINEFFPAKEILNIISLALINLDYQYNTQSFGIYILRCSFKRTGRRFKGQSVKGYLIS